MPDFQPIPGVVYSDTITPMRAVYAPRWEDDPKPWLSELDGVSGGRIDQLPNSFREDYNPHPPTETVYMVIAGGASSKPIFGEWETEEEARQDRDLEYGGKLFERQVTKWREI